MGSELINSETVNGLIEWFENHYTPGEKGENGNPRAASLMIKGLKGNIVIDMIYETDLIAVNKARGLI